MIRYLVSALLAVATMAAILFLLSRVTGPGQPGELWILRQIELFDPSRQEPPTDDAPPPRRPHERNR